MALAASAVALLSLAGSASAASFAANPASLGPIPDGSGCGTTYGANRDVTFTVSGVASPIQSIAVSMTLSPPHTWVGDLSVALIAPGGSPSQAVFHRTGASSPTSVGYGANVAGPYTFSDTAPASPTWWEAAFANAASTIPSGSYRPSTPGEDLSGGGGANTLFLPVFSAATPNGTWTLRFRDKCSNETGSVSAATLFLDGAAAGGAGTLGGGSSAPSNQFTIGKLKKTTLSVDVKSAGTVKVGDAKDSSFKARSAKKKKLLLKPSSASGGPGTIKVKLKLTSTAKKKLRKKGKVKVKAKIIFTPTGGQSASKTKSLTVKKKRRK